MISNEISREYIPPDNNCDKIVKRLKSRYNSDRTMSHETEAQCNSGTQRCIFYRRDNGLRVADFGEELQTISGSENPNRKSVKKKWKGDRKKRSGDFLDISVPPKKVRNKEEAAFFPNTDSQNSKLFDIKTSKKTILTKSRDPRLNRIDSIGPKSQKTRPLKSAKRVSFNIGATKIITYQIKSGNAMKKCPSKDAHMSIKKRRTRAGFMDRELYPQFEQFLMHIFFWNPESLEKQIQLGRTSLVVNEKKLTRVLSKYETYQDYRDVTEPLLILELWHGLMKNVDVSGKNPTDHVLSSIIKNSINLTTIPSTNIRITTLMLEVVVSKREIDSKSHATSGDLIVLEYASKIKENTNICKIFAYVTSIRETGITSVTHFNRNLLNFVKEAYALLTYTIMTKPLDPTEIQTNQTVGLKKISYPSFNIRMLQALQYLFISPILEQILHPNIEDFQLAVTKNIENYPNVTKDKLNAKQFEAVVRITETAVQQIPKICLIEGPPGTGKSRIVVNLVMEILYGAGRYAHEQPLRILVCSSSNAAIDEIVLRLLKIREMISQNDHDNRFKMVRLGEIEKMHPLVKKVALPELAKLAVKKTTANYLSRLDDDCIEEEKRKLQARINALELELLSSQNTCSLYPQRVARKLNDVKAKYDLVTTRQSGKQIESLRLDNLQIATEETLLAGADIISCPLEFCYTNRMESVFSEGDEGISVCIIDEATRCTEAETLVPLMLGVRTLVLVGDSNEVTSTVKSGKARHLGLNQSLFGRIRQTFMGKNGNPIIQLDTQYRMSYPVALWPNRYFFSGGIKNAANLHKLPFPRYKIIDIDFNEKSDEADLEDEIIFIADLVQVLVSQSNVQNLRGPVKIGIITMHRSQNGQISKKIDDRFKTMSDDIKKIITYDVNTIDEFRGQERDLVIITCFGNESLDILSNRQKLCVALTRAKHSLIICGDFRNFWRNSMLNNLLSDAKPRGVYVKTTVPSTAEKIKRYVLP